MGLEVGIVGLPNVGKSTLFRALTKAQVEAANYPFCTIEPNVGIVPIKDARMDRLVDMIVPDKIVPSTLRIVDIAGLVKGASQGEGLGNQFLSHIRQMDAIAHVVRCFDDDNVVHVSGKPDPIDDLDVIQTELILADLEQVERKLEKSVRQAKGDKTIAASIPVFERMRDHLGEGLLAKKGDWNEDELEVFQELNLITMKSDLYVANVSEEGLTNVTEYEKALRERARVDGVEVVKICAQVESELSEMEEDEAIMFMDELGIERSGLEQLGVACYALLDQITFLTAGKQEVRAWNIVEGSTAPQAAGKIHTDFEKGFIRAEVFHYNDIDELGSEAAVKDAGRWRLEGKEYVVQDGDIMHFRFNV